MNGRIAKLDRLLLANRPSVGWEDIIPRVPEGVMLELGVYIGTNFKEICARAAPRKVWGFDWWRGLSEDWGVPGTIGALDMGGVPPFEPPENGEFVIGRVEETLPGFVADHPPAAFVHFDMDVYGPTAAALGCLKFAPGAILAFDEIDNHNRNHNHEQRAFREWLERTEVDFEFLGQRHAESWVIQLT